MLVAPAGKLVGRTAEFSRLTRVLDEAAAQEAMAEHLTALAQRPLDAAELQAIIRRAEGNAYYAEELLAASACGSDLPAGLAELLLARLQRLSPAGQQVVHAAAVVGRRVDDDLVRLAFRLPE